MASDEGRSENRRYDVQVRETASYLIEASNREEAEARALALFRADKRHTFSFTVSRWYHEWRSEGRKLDILTGASIAANVSRRATTTEH